MKGSAPEAVGRLRNRPHQKRQMGEMTMSDLNGKTGELSLDELEIITGGDYSISSGDPCKDAMRAGTTREPPWSPTRIVPRT